MTKQISRFFLIVIHTTYAQETEQHSESNKKHIQYCPWTEWQSARHVVASRIVECKGRIQLFKLWII